MFAGAEVGCLQAETAGLLLLQAHFHICGTGWFLKHWPDIFAFDHISDRSPFPPQLQIISSSNFALLSKASGETAKLVSEVLIKGATGCGSRITFSYSQISIGIFLGGHSLSFLQL